MDISKVALGLAAAVGLVAGAAGAYVASHVGKRGAGRAARGRGPGHADASRRVVRR